MAGSRFQLIPRVPAFFEMFEQSARHVERGAAALVDLLESYVDVDRKVRAIKDIEHDGDEATHQIYNALDRSFVTPFDRDDIGRLAASLDDVLDWAEDAARRIAIYRLTPTERAKRFARILLDQAQAIQRAMALLRDLKQERELREQVVELHRLENEADDLMAETLGVLYEGVTDIPGVIRAVQWGDVYEVLEEATDKAEHVGMVIGSILVKHA